MSSGLYRLCLDYHDQATKTQKHDLYLEVFVSSCFRGSIQSVLIRRGRAAYRIFSLVRSVRLQADRRGPAKAGHYVQVVGAVVTKALQI